MIELDTTYRADQENVIFIGVMLACVIMFYFTVKILTRS